MKRIRINRPTLYVLVILLSLIIGIIIGVIVIKHRNGKAPSPITANEHFIYINTYDDPLTKEKDEVTIFKTYEEYTSLLSDDKLTENDFKDYNYALIPIMYDSCSEKNIVPTSYDIEGNNITVTITYESTCGVCAPSYIYYLLRVDKSLTRANLEIKSKPIKQEECDPNVAYKPMIYLYPEVETAVTVTLGHPEYLTTTYPSYENSWQVKASPDGTLTDDKNRSYYGLYWEGQNHQSSIKKDGFIVEKDNIIPFLEEKLSLLGLNDKEANEFIVYWLPKLEQSEYNYIRFETIDEINSYMPLTITPEPDNIIRILMAYKPLDEKISVQPQELTTPSRTGFTVVEWGGTLIK